jgi:hypothetical protein
MEETAETTGARGTVGTTVDLHGLVVIIGALVFNLLPYRGLELVSATRANSAAARVS